MNQNTKTSNLIKTIVIICDFLVLNILLYAYVRWNWAVHDFTNGTRGMILAVLANFGMVFAQFFFSTVVHERRTTSEQILRQVTLLVLLHGAMTFLISSVFFQHDNLKAPDFKFTVYFTLVLYVGILFSRYCERWIIKRYRSIGRNRRTVIFIGSDPLIIPVYKFLVGNQFMGYHVLGYYADNRIENCPEGLEYKGSLNDFENVMENSSDTNSADELYCSIPVTEHKLTRRIMRYCNSHVIHFYYIPSFSQVFGHTAKFEHVGDTIVFTNYDEPLTNPTNRFLKRAFDLADRKSVV